MSSRLIALVALGSVTALRLPFFVRDRPIAHAAVLAPFVLSIGWALPRMQPGILRRGSALLTAAFVGLTGLALLRGSASHAYSTHTTQVWIDVATYATVAIFALTLLASEVNTEARDQRATALALAPAAYVAVNVLLHLAGAVSPAY